VWLWVSKGFYIHPILELHLFMEEGFLSAERNLTWPVLSADRKVHSMFFAFPMS
jgi:hypothetical protein